MRFSDKEVAETHPPSAGFALTAAHGTRRTRPDPLLSADPLTKGSPPPGGPFAVNAPH